MFKRLPKSVQGYVVMWPWNLTLPLPHFGLCLLRISSWLAAVLEGVMIFYSLDMKVRMVPSNRPPQEFIICRSTLWNMWRM